MSDPADADVELVAMPALTLDAAFVHTNRADVAGNGQVLSPDPFFDTLFLGAAERRFVTAERIVDDGRVGRRAPVPARWSSTACSPTPWPRSPAEPTSPPTRPITGATRHCRRSTPPRPATPTRGRRSRERYVFVTTTSYQARLEERQP